MSIPHRGSCFYCYRSKPGTKQTPPPNVPCKVCSQDYKPHDISAHFDAESFIHVCPGCAALPKEKTLPILESYLRNLLRQTALSN